MILTWCWPVTWRNRRWGCLWYCRERGIPSTIATRPTRTHHGTNDKVSRQSGCNIVRAFNLLWIMVPCGTQRMRKRVGPSLGCVSVVVKRLNVHLGDDVNEWTTKNVRDRGARGILHGLHENAQWRPGKQVDQVTEIVLHYRTDSCDLRGLM